MPTLIDSRIAAEEIAKGKPLPYRDIKELSDSLEPKIDEVIVEMMARVPQIDYESDPIPQQREGANAVVDFLHDFEIDRICRDKRLIATLLVRLKDLQVRDFALGVMNDKTDLYYDAWRWLLINAPDGYRAAPATLLAVACYERGDGAMANIALEKALQDQPSYSMVNLLQQVFRSGKSPTIFKDLRSELHPKVCATIFSGSISS